MKRALRDNARIPQRTIYVSDGAEIDLADGTLQIPPGTTLASGRGRNRSPGGLLKSASEVYEPAFRVVSRRKLGTTRALPPVRITGLRFFGPNPYEDAPDCSSKGRSGILADERGSGSTIYHAIVDRVLEIDNNEFSAWPAYAISITGIHGAYVHHNNIHHSQRTANTIWCGIQFNMHALGYGVVTNNGLVYIEGNRFDHNRHSIASRGDMSMFTVAKIGVTDRTSRDTALSLRTTPFMITAKPL